MCELIPLWVQEEQWKVLSLTLKGGRCLHSEHCFLYSSHLRERLIILVLQVRKMRVRETELQLVEKPGSKPRPGSQP